MSNYNQEDHAVLARQYAKHYGIPEQAEGESDVAFRERVAGKLREMNRIIEANEAYHNKRYEDGESPLTGIMGAITNMLTRRGSDLGLSGDRQIGLDMATGIIQRYGESDMNPQEALLLVMFSGSDRSYGDYPQVQQSNALQRVKELRREGKKGVEIAMVLLEEDCDIKSARDAFYELRYVVNISPHTVDIEELFVSDYPQDGLAVLWSSSAPLTLPSVVWTKK